MIHAALTTGLTLLIVGSLVVLFVRRDKTAALIDADESARWFELVREQPEPTWDVPTDLVRERLHHVDLVRPAPFGRVPSQRRAGERS